MNFFGKIKNRIEHTINSTWLIVKIFPNKKKYIYSQRVLLPREHNLTDILNIYPQYSQNLKRVFNEVIKKYKLITVIDVGANIGDSVILFNSVKHVPILAVEGDKKYFRYLIKNTAKVSDIRAINTYLGNIIEKTTVRSTSKHGTLNLITGKKSLETKIDTLDHLLTAHNNFRHSKLYKIDTDGFDTKIIKGSLNYIKNAKPIIFFEFVPDLLFANDENPPDIFRIFGRLGYKKMLIYDNLGDFIISLDFIDRDKIEDIVNYFTGWGEKKYCDIVVFHKDDVDIFNKLRRNEIRTKIKKSF
ncbi:MAG: hypothetical protein ACD_24C00508G0004 [uncultured bacterium]|nr:MAG: hypothetical protein ACD_24C00508G0004 [uncultured bacterium]